MNELIFKNHIIAGGLTFLNDQNIELRETQINLKKKILYNIKKFLE